MKRRAVLKLSALPLCDPGSGVAAQSLDGSVRLIVPYAPGGGIDGIGRLLAQRMEATSGESWVVKNRSGGNGIVGAEAVARAVPDGCTLMMSADIHTIAREVMRSVPYDPIRDFTPVARVAHAPLLLVGSPDLEARSFAELVVDVRARPMRYSFANSALGSMGHLATETFKKLTGSDLLLVSYRGTGPALNDVVAGSVSLMLVPLPSAITQVQAGLLRAYAITSPARSPLAPEVPSVAEAGMPGLEFDTWYGVWGPKGLLPATTARLNAAIQDALSDAETAARLATLGGEPVREDSAGFARFIDESCARMKRIIADAGIQPE
jgi:tripartite-type tricarboxylate transporter receptor subunit TctC